MRRLLITALFFFVACGDSSTDPTGTGAGGAAGGAGGSTVSVGGAGGDGGTADLGGGGTGGVVDKAANCADEFGSELTASFGRLDGTVLAVVRPSDTQCTLFNNDHVVLEVTMNGAVYRLVINIKSDFGDPDVRFLVLEHDAPGAPWAEGWHPNAQLDYVVNFGVHVGSPFTPIPMDELAQRVTDEIQIGQKVSVYADSSGGSSAHKIHRNGGSRDGAIILEPDSATPKVMLFHFENQTF
ncbi:MAG: hypothetical protein U0271_06075 [Polyangiaceae bacterium]